MWTGISEKMLPREYLLIHRGVHVDRNFREKYHRGIPFEVRNTVLQARNNSWTAGTNFKSTEVLGGIFPTEALLFFHRGLTQRLCWTGCIISGYRKMSDCYYVSIERSETSCPSEILKGNDFDHFTPGNNRKTVI